ncbi:MAG: mandelate racemase [Planctomycetaceae bacterium]|nr:mandelate racemase [Planctomycetaceae bacterium]
MRLVDIRQATVPISRYADASISSGNLDTTIVAIITDAYRAGEPIVGFGFSSIGRYGQSGLIRDRFAPRLLAAPAEDLCAADGNIDPFRAWQCMMLGEKPGGHGERCVAVGTLDMALWDLAAKVAEEPLYQFLGKVIGIEQTSQQVPVYAGGGYYFPDDDIGRLTTEVRQFLDQGHTHIKMKIGAVPLEDDLKRIEAILDLLPDGSHLAVDAMNRYSPEMAIRAAQALQPYKLWWFEDICDPLDFTTHERVAAEYSPPIAAGEALFSAADATNLIRYAGLRRNHDIFVFDPVHCYGVPEYLQIAEMLEDNGWSRQSCWPHGGHLFSLHLAAALKLGGNECNPHNFQPFGGFADGAEISEGFATLPDVPGVGFATRPQLMNLFSALLT